MRGLALLLAVTLNAAPLAAQQYETGEEAYAARDWAAAKAIWTTEAANGSAKAMLGLGNLLDFGLNGPNDPEGAYAQYVAAAELGLAEAAFNVAVMLDAGVGVSREPLAAAGWYSLAALDDFARAQYNLGQLYAAGDGVPQNGPMADLWLEKAAATVPAARDRRATIDTTPGTELIAPLPIQLQIRQDGAGALIRGAWAAPAGPETVRYRLEIADIAEPEDPVIAGTETDASAASVQVAGLPRDLAWRVLSVTDTDYAASTWQRPDGQTVDLDDEAVVRFQVRAEDRRALGYAERMGAALTRSGLGVRYDVSDSQDEASAVTYRFDSDSEIAALVAEFLPGLGEQGAIRDTGPDLRPGEVRVRIVFDAVQQN